MRFAVYYSPSQMSLLHELGASWLGYNAFDGKNLPQPGDGLLTGKTEQPSQYGFHATLKAPFQLKPNSNFADLRSGVSAIAAKLHPVTISKLILSQGDGFLALVPEIQESDLSHLAATCVKDLDHLRREMDEAEIKRRQMGVLTPSENDYLIRWGYPYIFDAYRFHMTLTRQLKNAEMAEVAELAQHHFADIIGQPLHISTLTTFIEVGPGVHFRVADVFPLAEKTIAAYA